MPGKTVIKMAKEAGLFVFNDSIHPRDNDEPLNTYLERFAALVREDEREACAKVCDEDESGRDGNGYYAEVIRARGYTK